MTTRCLLRATALAALLALGAEAAAKYAPAGWNCPGPVGTTSGVNCDQSIEQCCGAGTLTPHCNSRSSTDHCCLWNVGSATCHARQTCCGDGTGEHSRAFCCDEGSFCCAAGDPAAVGAGSCCPENGVCCRTPKATFCCNQGDACDLVNMRCASATPAPTAAPTDAPTPASESTPAPVTAAPVPVTPCPTPVPETPCPTPAPIPETPCPTDAPTPASVPTEAPATAAPIPETPCPSDAPTPASVPTEAPATATPVPPSDVWNCPGVFGTTYGVNCDQSIEQCCGAGSMTPHCIPFASKDHCCLWNTGSARCTARQNCCGDGVGADSRAFCCDEGSYCCPAANPAAARGASCCPENSLCCGTQTGSFCCDRDTQVCDLVNGRCASKPVDTSPSVSEAPFPTLPYGVWNCPGLFNTTYGINCNRTVEQCCGAGSMTPHCIPFASKDHCCLWNTGSARCTARQNCCGDGVGADSRAFCCDAGSYCCPAASPAAAGGASCCPENSLCCGTQTGSFCCDRDTQVCDLVNGRCASKSGAPATNMPAVPIAPSLNQPNATWPSSLLSARSFESKVHAVPPNAGGEQPSAAFGASLLVVAFAAGAVAIAAAV